MRRDEGMVQWNLLVRQTVKPAPNLDPFDNGFQHSDLPQIMMRCEMAKTAAAGIRFLTALLDTVNMLLAPLAREKRGLEKWL